MTVYFSSDLHFNHVNVIKYCNRPWVDVDEMNEGLIDRWNTMVKPADTVWILGDLHLGAFSKAAPLVSRLAGRKLLIPGNHDGCWFGSVKQPKRVRVRQEMFDAGIGRIIDSRSGTSFFLSDATPVSLHHFPWRNDYPDNVDLSDVDQRHREWWPDQPGPGRWLLHGHVHERWQVWPDARQINVGVDVHQYRPVAEEWIIEKIKEHA